MVYSLTRSYYEPLIRAGVRIYEYTPGFIHAKSYLVDDEIGVVGTINMDYRSLYLHMEDAVLLTGCSALQKLIDCMVTIEKSRRVTLQDCKRRRHSLLWQAILRTISAALRYANTRRKPSVHLYERLFIPIRTGNRYSKRLINPTAFPRMRMLSAALPRRPAENTPGFRHQLQDGIDLVIVDPFQRCLIVNDDSGDLAVFHHGLAADKDGISVVDPCADHAVSTGEQTEICGDLCVGDEKSLPILLGEDRFAAKAISPEAKPFQSDGSEIRIVLRENDGSSSLS